MASNSATTAGGAKQPMSILRFIVLMIKGAAMGTANVIPGVSGGTVALIAGIYEELVATIKSVGWQATRLLFRGNFRKAFEHVNGPFLCAIGIGLLASVFTLAHLLNQMLREHEILTLSFFFGLILASVFSVGRRVPRWYAQHVLLFLAGTGLAVAIVLLRHAGPNPAPLYMFLCGVVAISAMILPGISGSFILLLMGNYLLVMAAIGNFQLSVLAPFAAGCVIGLMAFSRVLSFILEKWHYATLSLLTGFVAGSLTVIWPWKIKKYLLGDGGEAALRKGKKILIGYEWHLPAQDQHLLLAVLLMLAGAGLVPILEFFAQNKPKPAKTPRE
ncbi:MAG: DUF368 domain-containing protein [Verrucomicrobiota bacterium]|nr:DUF368 domain-containing protein [Verrucomicrobiota bacterium]